MAIRELGSEPNGDRTDMAAARAESPPGRVTADGSASKRPCGGSTPPFFVHPRPVGTGGVGGAVSPAPSHAASPVPTPHPAASVITTAPRPPTPSALLREPNNCIPEHGAPARPLLVPAPTCHLLCLPSTAETKAVPAKPSACTVDIYYAGLIAAPRARPTAAFVARMRPFPINAEWPHPLGLIETPSPRSSAVVYPPSLTLLQSASLISTPRRGERARSVGAVSGVVWCGGAIPRESRRS